MTLSRQRALVDARDIVWGLILTQSDEQPGRATRVLLHVWYYLRVQLGQKVPLGKERKYGNKEKDSQ